ncbi:Nn.00g095850.m01.CDS01 [Neocucurbitaria sp. VM-36]
MSEGDNTGNIEERVFTAIISMCRLRILCRLRFVPNNRNTPRQSMKSVLEEAISSLAQVPVEDLGDQISSAQPFVERAKDVIKLADAWEKHQTPARLKDLIEGVSRLKQTGKLQDLLGSIPNRVMDPSSRQNLTNIVSKVSRYREAAHFLCRMAKRHRIVRQMKVTLANLPKEAFHKVLSNDHTPRLASTLIRINGRHQRPDVSHLCRLMKTTEIQSPEEEFATQTRRTLRQGKIHAEIQLVYYCELNASRLPPRVICSSKDACFLCNAFILMNAKMYMPRYHGRLYPGWRLPNLPHLDDMAQRLNLVLENQARASLRTLLERNKKTVYPDPNESTLLTLAVSTSTLRTLALSEGIRAGRRPDQTHLVDETRVQLDLLVSPSNQASAISSEHIGTANSESDIETSSMGTKDSIGSSPSNQVASQLFLRNPCSSRAPSSRRTSDDDWKLVQETDLVQGVAVNSKSRLYTAGCLEIHLEYPINPTLGLAEGTSKDLSCGIEWLPDKEARGILEHKAMSVIDVETLQDEKSHELDDQKCLYLRAHGVVVKIMRHHA